MIVPMKKVSLILLGDKKTETLKKLRKLGLVHIEIAEGAGERIDQLKEQMALLESGIFILEDKRGKNTEAQSASLASLPYLARNRDTSALVSSFAAAPSATASAPLFCLLEHLSERSISRRRLSSASKSNIPSRASSVSGIELISENILSLGQ